MEIKNINNTPNFTGIYKIRNVNNGMIREIREHLPEYVGMTRNPAHMFTGSHPMEPAIVGIIKESVEECKTYSYSWLVQNAKIHGLKLPEADCADVWLVTGKEIKLVKEFLSQSDKLIKKADTFLSKMKYLLFENQEKNYSPNMPEYLKNLLPTIKHHEEMAGIYQELMKGEKIVEAKNVQDLFMKMFMDAR